MLLLQPALFTTPVAGHALRLRHRERPRLCGRVVKVLPNGVAELQAKGKKAEDVLGCPALCVASAADQTWPWKGGVFNLDDSTPYWDRLGRLPFAIQRGNASAPFRL